MGYTIIFEKKAQKSLSRLEITQQRIIVSWIMNNLENTENPRARGKALKGELNEYWRYRIGDYRLIAQIKDKEIIILIIDISHRKNAYQ